MTRTFRGRRPSGRPVSPAATGLALAALLVLAPDTAAVGVDRAPGLSGTVTADGAALAGTWVTLTPVDKGGRPSGQPQRTVTDPSGRYEFAQLAAGHVKVGARGQLFGELVDTYWPQAYTFAEADVIEVTTGRSTAHLELPVGGSARGRVVDARTGAPVEGADVTATMAENASAGSVGAVGPVDGPGRFSLTGLPPVPVQISVSLPPGSPYLAPSADRSRPSRALRLDGGARTTDVTIALRRAAGITGTVLDDAGDPVVGADVRLVGCLPGCPRHATTDAMGRYRLVGVAPGTRLAVVAQPAWGLLGPWYPSREATARVTDLEVGAGDVVDGVDLTLTRPAFVSLDVLGADLAEPLRAIVRLTTTGRTYSQYFSGGAVVQPWGMGEPGGVADPAGGPPPASSIRLSVGPVPPGEYSLGISLGVADPGYLPTRWVTDSGEPSTPTLRLGPGEENRSVVSLTPPRGEPEPDVVASKTDPAGGWPGLAQGFLAPTGWTDPLG